jgi:hypothetical protein
MNVLTSVQENYVLAKSCHKLCLQKVGDFKTKISSCNYDMSYSTHCWCIMWDGISHYSISWAVLDYFLPFKQMPCSSNCFQYFFATTANLRVCELSRQLLLSIPSFVIRIISITYELLRVHYWIHPWISYEQWNGDKQGVADIVQDTGKKVR